MRRQERLSNNEHFKSLLKSAPCIGYNLHVFLLYLLTDSDDSATTERYSVKCCYSVAAAAAVVAAAVVAGATADVDFAGVVVEDMASMMKCWSCLR